MDNQVARSLDKSAKQKVPLPLIESHSQTFNIHHPDKQALNILLSKLKTSQKKFQVTVQENEYLRT